MRTARVSSPIFGNGNAVAVYVADPSGSYLLCVQAYVVASAAKRRYAFMCVLASLTEAKTDAPSVTYIPPRALSLRLYAWYAFATADTPTVSGRTDRSSRRSTFPGAGGGTSANPVGMSVIASVASSTRAASAHFLPIARPACETASVVSSFADAAATPPLDMPRTRSPLTSALPIIGGSSPTVSPNIKPRYRPPPFRPGPVRQRSTRHRVHDPRQVERPDGRRRIRLHGRVSVVRRQVAVPPDDRRGPRENP